MGLFSKLTDALKDAAPVIGGVVGFGLGGPMGASIGSGIGGLVAGEDVGTSLGYAALGGIAGLGAKGLGFTQAGTGATGIGRFMPQYAPGAGAQVAQVAGAGDPYAVAGKMGQSVQEAPGFFDQGIGKFMADNKLLTGAAALGAGALLLGGEEEEEATQQRPFPKGEAYFGDTYTDPFTGEEYSYEDPGDRTAIRESKAKLRDPMFDYERDLPAFRGYYEDGGEVVGPGTGTSDSVPARLSDGEFVLTAKAVRNAGGGDRDVGAARMYDMMAQLEAQA